MADDGGWHEGAGGRRRGAAAPRGSSGRSPVGAQWGQAPGLLGRPSPPPPASLKALPAEPVQHFLALVQEGDYQEALKALRKVRRAVKGRGCSKEAFGGLRALLHHLLEGYACAGRLPEALELLGEMKTGTEGRLVSAAAFNALLRGLLTRGALAEARKVVRDEMPRLGVAPNEASFNLLMDTAARGGAAHIEEAWDLLEEMQSKSLRADKYTVSILTKGITDRGDKRRGGAPRGIALVERFLAAQPEDVDEVLINSLLLVFCRMGDMPRLEATLQKMREYGIRGSAVTYGTIVKAYGKTGNIDRVVQAWEEMTREGLEANAVTYGCMLDACVKCGHLDKALQVFAQMKHRGLHRNTILYATLIKGFAKSKDPGAAKALQAEMVREGVSCNVVVFNSIIDACVRANDLSAAAEVLQQMTVAGVQPDLITFSTLIKGYCSSGELQKAMRLADELQARKLDCDEIMFNSLLEGCVKAGDMQLGLKLFNDMKDRGVRPSGVTFSILVKLLSRACRLDLACQLVAHDMRRIHNVQPTRMVWSCLVMCAVKARDLTRAAWILELLDGDGGVAGAARASMYAAVIEACLAHGELPLGLQLCEKAYTREPQGDHSAAAGADGASGAGHLSTELLRKVFDAAGARGGLDAEVRGAMEAVGRRSSKARAACEEALAQGASGGARSSAEAVDAAEPSPSSASAASPASRPGPRSLLAALGEAPGAASPASALLQGAGAWPAGEYGAYDFDAYGQSAAWSQSAALAAATASTGPWSAWAEPCQRSGQHLGGAWAGGAWPSQGCWEEGVHWAAYAAAASAAAVAAAAGATPAQAQAQAASAAAAAVAHAMAYGGAFNPSGGFAAYDDAVASASSGAMNNGRHGAAAGEDRPWRGQSAADAAEAPGTPRSGRGERHAAQTPLGKAQAETPATTATCATTEESPGSLLCTPSAETPAKREPSRSKEGAPIQIRLFEGPLSAEVATPPGLQ